MNKNRKKRSQWQIFLWGLRHPWLYCRAAAIYEIHRKRVLREYIEWDYKVNKKEYDREFEKAWRRERRELYNPRKRKTGVFPNL